jgi:hypothetical protein
MTDELSIYPLPQADIVGSLLLKEGGIAMRYAAMTDDWHSKPTDT